MILGNNAVVRKIKQFAAHVHTNRQSIYREPVTYFFLDRITTAGFRILLLTTIVKRNVIVNIYAD